MRSRWGQGLVEYVLIVALVAVTLVAALALFRNTVATELIGPVDSVAECATPGEGGARPGRDNGTAPGQCRKGQCTGGPCKKSPADRHGEASAGAAITTGEPYPP
jgi:Flp pilus assembly pilin Flp